MTIRDAMSRVLSGHNDCKVTTVLDMNQFYAVCIKPNSFDADKILMDPYYSVDKTSGKVSEWAPSMDLKGFKEALAHGVVYKEGDDLPEEKPDVLKHSEEMTLDELYHHGILGMKWGVRRFQPYQPGQKVKGGKEVGLATKVKQKVTGIADDIKQHKVKKQKAAIAKKAAATKKANADYAAAKKKAIESGTVEDLAKFKGDLTNEEYGRAFARIQNEQKLSAMVAANEKTVWDTIDKGMAIAQRLTGYANTVANFKGSMDNLSDRLNKSKKEDEKKAKDKAKFEAFANVENITELDEAFKKHGGTLQEYQSAMNILANKKQNRLRFGKLDDDGKTVHENEDFINQNRKAADAKAAAEKAANDEARAKMNAEKEARKADKAYEKARKNATKGVMDGEWQSMEGHKTGIKGMKWDVRPKSTQQYKEIGTQKASQLLLTMKDATPSSYSSDKRTISGAKSGKNSTVRSTSALSFGDKTQLVKRGKSSTESDQVKRMRSIVEETQKGKKARKNYKP